MGKIILTTDYIQPDFETSKSITPDAGAVAVFCGVVRKEGAFRALRALFYESYVSMAEKELQDLASAMEKKYSLEQFLLKHRLGEVKVGEISLYLLISAKRRSPAFSAMEETISLLKQRVPIWKKAIYEDNTTAWLLD